MKKFSTLAILLILAIVGTASAQDKSYKKVTIGLAAEAALPLGSFSNAYNLGAGATLRAAFALDATSAITGTTGAIAFIPKSLKGVDLKAELNIPIKAGYKYMLSSNLYALGEAGVTLAKVYYPDQNNHLQSVSNSEFTYAINLGTTLGAFDASVRYEGYSGTGFAALRVGFNF